MLTVMTSEWRLSLSFSKIYVTGANSYLPISILPLLYRNRTSSISWAHGSLQSIA